MHHLQGPDSRPASPIRLSAPPRDAVAPVRIVETLSSSGGERGNGPPIRLSSPPPDALAPVRIVGTLSSPCRERGNDPPMRLSSPPPDALAPVRIVGTLSSSEAKRGDAPPIRLAPPPADVVEPVRIVERRPGAGAGRHDSPAIRLSQPPQDVLENVTSAPPPHAATGSISTGVANQERAFSGSTRAAHDDPSLKSNDYQREIDGAPDPESPPGTASRVPLDNQEIHRIISAAAPADSGEDRHRAVSADREFQTPGHDAYQRRHFGLGFGLVLFTQASGHLGSLLRIMHRRDAGTFNAIFGEHADELLATTSAVEERARLEPVGGEPLWSESWIEKFKRAGDIPTFQAAQNEEAIENQFRPMLRAAFGFGMDTDRSLAMVYDRVVVLGLGGGVRRVARLVGPLRTAAQRAHALESLGFRDVGDFQSRVDGLSPTGVFTPETHAALAGELRRRGNIPLPDVGELMHRMVRLATGEEATRLSRLYESNRLDDTAFRPPAEELHS